MPAIAGIVYPDIFQVTNSLSPMLEIMKHRGEPVRDTFALKNITLGAVGQKFVLGENHQVVINLDGMIYNQPELKKKLKLKSNDLGEILLSAYAHWGTSFLEKIDGNFSLVLLDQRKKRLLLARDRIGKKPLYWYHDNRYFLFASELKAIIASGLVPQTPALDALSSYLYFGYIPQDMSPIENVNKLLPAHSLIYHFDDTKTIHPYWSYSSCFAHQTKLTQKEIVSTLNSLLTESVAARIPKNEEIGSFVSGGLGSASITYYLSKGMPKEKIKAYTMGFCEENKGDMAVAEELSKKLSISQKSDCIEPPDFLTHLPEIVWHLDEPIADPNTIAIWKLAKLAKNDHRQIVFSGMGSDELLAGHSRYSTKERHFSPIVMALHPLENLLKKALIPLFNLLYQPAALSLLKSSRTNPWQFNYLDESALFQEKELEQASPKLAKIFDPEIFLHKFHRLDQIKSVISSLLYIDIKTRLPDCYMLQLERLTMAHGLDWKAPFLDRHIIEFLAGIPAPNLLPEKETASYLKTIVKGILPQSIVDRPKRTRKRFLSSWIEQKEMLELFKLLRKSTLVSTGLISKEWLEQQLETLGASPRAFRYLWALMHLELWFRLFINHPIELQAPQRSVKDILSEPM